MNINTKNGQLFDIVRVFDYIEVKPHTEYSICLAISNKEAMIEDLKKWEITKDSSKEIVDACLSILKIRNQDCSNLYTQRRRYNNNNIRSVDIDIEDDGKNCTSYWFCEEQKTGKVALCQQKPVEEHWTPRFIVNVYHNRDIKNGEDYEHISNKAWNCLFRNHQIYQTNKGTFWKK